MHTVVPWQSWEKLNNLLKVVMGGSILHRPDHVTDLVTADGQHNLKGMKMVVCV